MRLVQSIVLILLALTALPAAGLDPDRSLDDYLHQHWTIPDGLPQNSINGMALGPGGYLWLATYDGLARFDGHRFVREDPDGLPGRRLSLHGGDADGLWIGGEQQGLVYFDGEEVTPVEVAEDRIQWPVNDVLVHGDELWIAAMNGVHRVADEGRGEYLGPHPALPGGPMMALELMADGRIAVGADSGLYLQAEDGFRPWVRDALPTGAVNRLLADEDGLWMAVGASVFRLEGGETRPVHVESPEPTVDRVLSLGNDSDGNLWIGHSSGDVIRITADGRSDRHSGDGLHHSVEVFLEDPEGNLWIGTDGNGLHRIRDGKAISHGGPNSPVGGPMMAVSEHPEGGLLAGGHCTGLIHFEARERLGYWDETDGLENTCIAGLLVDDEERIWVATHSGGVFRSRGDGFAAVPLPFDASIFSALFQDREGRIWAGGWDGLFRFDEEAGRDVGRLAHVPATEDVQVQSIHQDDQDRLWLATDRGAYVSEEALDGNPPDTDALGFREIGVDEGLPDAPLRDIHFDRDGAWFALFGGGLVYWSDGEAIPVGPEQGLAEDVVSRILADDGDNFWLSGHRGISRVPREQLRELLAGEREQLEVERIGSADGLRVSETNGGGQPAGIRHDDGSLWFPTVDGLVRILPDRIRRNTVPPRMHIESVLVDGRPRSPSGPVFMGPDAETLEIQYTGISFTNPEAVRFEYRLKGDEDWTDNGHMRHIRLSRPEGGEYEFRVRATNEEGVRSEQAAGFDLVVEPRFRETVWFPVSLFTGGALLILMLLAAYVLQSRLRRAQLEREVTHQTRALRKANRQLERQARVDGLTGVGNRRHLTAMLEREWRRCRREDAPLSVAIFDIDRFKSFNDHSGHLQGDDCLREVARCLQDNLRRPADLVARYGGEEFVVVLPDTELEVAGELAERLRRNVEALAFPHPDSEVAAHVTVSGGVAAIRPRSGDGIMTVLQAADEALYRAKEAGRNQVHVSANAAGSGGGQDSTGPPA